MNEVMTPEELSVLISSQEKYHLAIKKVMGRYCNVLPDDLADELEYLRRTAQQTLETAKEYL